MVGDSESVEDPFVVADFFLDVVGDGAAQPLLPVGQARAAGHQQRNGMLDVVEGAGEKADVVPPVDPPSEGGVDQRGGEQGGALVGGRLLKLRVEIHGGPVLSQD